jgi:rod shape-determining protein MreC
MAEVTLITDKDQAVPVRVERNGVRSVVFGTGAGRAPELRFMAPNADIKQGDKLLTSGIDGTYPAGLAVAMVDSDRSRDRADVREDRRASPLAGPIAACTSSCCRRVR